MSSPSALRAERLPRVRRGTGKPPGCHKIRATRLRQAAPRRHVSQKIITTGTLSLVVDESALSHVVAELQAIATSLGGYVSTSNVALAGSVVVAPWCSVFQLETFQKAVSEAESLGTLKHLSTTATDVTGQVADLGAQVSALKAARTQLEALFARAGTIQALLSVQNEITSVQSQIQQLQAQQRVLANEISFSSLTVALAMPSRDTRLGA